MTDDELDEARAREAGRLLNYSYPYDGPATMAKVAARLARENWQPTDLDLVLAREVVAKVWRERNCPIYASEADTGMADGGVAIVVALAAIRAARGEAG